MAGNPGLGKKEQEKGQQLICYAHNVKYDFFNIADLDDPHIRIFSEEPFIAGYYVKIQKKISNEKWQGWKQYAEIARINYNIIKIESGNRIIELTKEIIRFLDSYSLIRRSLKEIGEAMKYEKLETPKELSLNWKLENKLQKYIKRDCEIVMKIVEHIKKILKDEKIKLKKVCTISQVGVQYIVHKIKEHKTGEGLFYEDKCDSIKTKYKQEIHQAYRGGRVECFKTGIIEGVTSLDINSLYPYSIMNIKTPDMRTERKVYEPLRLYDLNELLDKIGISKALIKNKSCEIGLLPIRTINKSYIPKPGKYQIGSWTNLELKKAIEEGYEIIDIEYSILYEDNPKSNCFKEIYQEMYNNRLKDGEINRIIWKEMMNHSIGKFAQSRVGQELIIDSVEEAEKYLSENAEILRRIDGKMMYLYKIEHPEQIKSFYLPIIPTLVNAYARIKLYENMKKFGRENLIYVDTDSIMFTGETPYDIRISQEIGDFKIEIDKETGEPLIKKQAKIYGVKSKRIGNNIALSGISKIDLNLESFEKGQVIDRKMTGIKKSIKDRPGEFKLKVKDLNKQSETLKLTENIMEDNQIYIDYGIGDVSYFINHINEICNTNNNNLNNSE